MIYVPLLVNRFQKSVLLIVQYKYVKSCSGDFFLQNLILRRISCGTGFITEPSWLLHFHPTKMVGRKCFVQVRYQPRMGISGGPALNYFCMIHGVGRVQQHTRAIATYIHLYTVHIYICTRNTRAIATYPTYIHMYTVHIYICTRNTHELSQYTHVYM